MSVVVVVALVIVALIVLAPVALLGFTMFALWLPSYRNSRELAGASGPNPGAAAPTDAPPERTFPVAVVIAHGVLAVTTVVLVLLTMVGVGTG